MSRSEAILVIKLSALGDMVMAMPAFARIRLAHPGAYITLLTTPPYAALAAASPYFDAVDSGGRPDTALGWLALVRRLRRARYARVYDLQTNDRTALIFRALGPHPPPWSGVVRGCALPHRNPARMAMHSLERHAEQLRDAGIWPHAPIAPLSAPGPDLGWVADGPDPADTASLPLVLLVPGAAARRPRKRWPAEAYADLAERLIAHGLDVAIVGAAQERPLAHIIQARSPSARDLTGATDFAGIARLGARAALAIGNDTGPMHLLAAAGAPCVVLFSADSDPALSAPRGRVAVLRADDLATLSPEAVEDAALARMAGRGALIGRGALVI